MAATPESGYLLLADLTGYTAYLSRGEIEHAPTIAGDLLETDRRAPRAALPPGQVRGRRRLPVHGGRPRRRLTSARCDRGLVRRVPPPAPEHRAGVELRLQRVQPGARSSTSSSSSITASTSAPGSPGATSSRAARSSSSTDCSRARRQRPPTPRTAEHRASRCSRARRSPSFRSIRPLEPARWARSRSSTWATSRLTRSTSRPAGSPRASAPPGGRGGRCAARPRRRSFPRSRGRSGPT